LTRTQKTCQRDTRRGKPETPEKLASITITKEKFEEIKPELSALKASGVAIKGTVNNENPDKIKLIFDKKDTAKVEAAIGVSQAAANDEPLTAVQ
jgi:hypothetical protein